jgi:UDP-glucose 6-dehydrogenase
MLGQVLIRSGLEHDVDLALNAVGSDSRVGNKYLRFGFGFGGPCFPRDNRSFGHYAGRMGLKFNIGTIVDGFNREHTEFLTQYFKDANSHKKPFYMDSISYKKDTDIFEESQQYQVCQNLLDAGYTMYIEPNNKIPKTITDSLTSRYGDSVKFVGIAQLDTESIFKIEF